MNRIFKTAVLSAAMAGAMQHLEYVAAERHGLTFGEEPVGHAVARAGNTVEPALFLQIVEQRLVGCMVTSRGSRPAYP